MIINIKSLNGTIINVNVEETDTINQIKERIQEMEGIQPDQQRLVFNGSILKNESRINEFKITPGSILHMILALRGGNTDCENNNIVSSTIIDETSNLLLEDNNDTTYEIRLYSNQTVNPDGKPTLFDDTKLIKNYCCAIL